MTTEGPPVQDDAAYYRARAQQEIDAAMVAEPTAARTAHLQLAERYRELADALDRLSSSSETV